jgi:hypothetical protein
MLNWVIEWLVITSSKERMFVPNNELLIAMAQKAAKYWWSLVPLCFTHLETAQTEN